MTVQLKRPPQQVPAVVVRVLWCGDVGRLFTEPRGDREGRPFTPRPRPGRCADTLCPCPRPQTNPPVIAPARRQIRGLASIPLGWQATSRRGGAACPDHRLHQGVVNLHLLTSGFSTNRWRQRRQPREHQAGGVDAEGRRSPVHSGVGQQRIMSRVLGNGRRGQQVATTLT